MRTKRVVVVPYDEAWKNAFEEISILNGKIGNIDAVFEQLHDYAQNLAGGVL